MNLDIAVVAHPGRSAMAVKLFQDVDAQHLVWDEGHGARDTHERAWQALAKESLGGPDDWALVIEDDAIPCYRFRHCMTQALRVAPGPIASAYLGRGRPPDWQDAIARVMAHAVDWLGTMSLLHGVGVAVRADLLPELVPYVAPQRSIDTKLRRWREPMDEAITRFCQQKVVPVAYTHPSLLDHDPERPSLVGDDRERTHRVAVDPLRAADMTHRKAWWFEAKDDWSNTIAAIPTPRT